MARDFKDLDALIDQLQAQTRQLDANRADWKGLWGRIKDASAAFKQVRYPSRDEQQRAWERFQGIVQEVKERQAVFFEQKKATRSQSEQHLSRITSLAERSKRDSGLGDLALLLATGGMSLAIQVGVDALLGKSDPEHQRLKERSSAMKAAWAYLSEHKAEMIVAHKNSAFALLQEIKESLDDDWQHWKDAKQQARGALDAQRQAKQEAWQISQRSFILRLEEALDKLEAARERRQEHLEALIDRYRSARSDEYRNKVESWIDEERGRISDIEAKISDVRGKLSDARLRLNS